MWGVLSSLQLIQSQHLQHMLIESNSKVAVDMIQQGYINISYLQYVLAYIFHILPTPNMHLELHHVNHNANKCVDLLAH